MLIMITTDKLLRWTCYAVLSEVLYQIASRFYGKFKVKKITTLTKSLKEKYCPDTHGTQFHKVLFFPDSGIVCRRTLSGRNCKDKNCVAVHEGTSLSVFIDVMKFSQESLDVCVYMITCSLLADSLIECHKKGIVLRVITEERNSGEEGEIIGSQIGKLRASGIVVRCRSSSFWMHHKFLVADNEILVNGSFNWTTQAVMGNFENLVITSEQSLVNPFVLEFQRLWDILAPSETNS